LTLNFLLAQRFWGVAKGRYINFLNNNNNNNNNNNSFQTVMVFGFLSVLLQHFLSHRHWATQLNLK